MADKLYRRADIRTIEILRNESPRDTYINDLIKAVGALPEPQKVMSQETPTSINMNNRSYTIEEVLLRDGVTAPAVDSNTRAMLRKFSQVGATAYSADSKVMRQLAQELGKLGYRNVAVVEPVKQDMQEETASAGNSILKTAQKVAATVLMYFAS